MTTELIVYITGFVFIAFLTCVIFHLERKLREAQHDEMVTEIKYQDRVDKYIDLNDKYEKLRTDHGKLQHMKFKGLDVDVHDLTCLKDDCPDYEDDKCTGTFEYCNQCMVRVIRK